MTTTVSTEDLKRRMHGAVEALKHDLAGRAPCDKDLFDTNVYVRVASWRRIPEDLVNFDFLWSARANERLYSVASAISFIEESMACLRPGGLAVHVMSSTCAHPRLFNLSNHCIGSPQWRYP